MSDLPIPGLRPVETGRGADLRIWLDQPFQAVTEADLAFTGSVASEVWFETSSVTPTGEPELTAVRLSGGTHYRITYCDGMDFVINRAASELWVSWPSTLTIRDVPSYLLGPIVGAILRLRGTTCLHASAIQLGGRAIAFAGPAGAGKSTTAAAFAVRGIPVVSDDTIGLTESGPTWTVAPGYPRVRLWPQSAKALAEGKGRSALLPPGESGSTNRYHLDLTSRGFQFQREALPLGLVYLLEESPAGSATVAEPLTPLEGLMALVGNSFASSILDKQMRAREFEVLGRLVERVPIRRLARPTDLVHLTEFCESVLDDIASLGLAPSIAHAR